MALMPIDLPPGLVRSGSPYDSVGSYWDMSLMRWVGASARPLGGWIRKTGTALDSAVRRIFAWRHNDDTLGTLLGTEHKLYVDFAGGWLDITPAGIVPPVVSFAGGYGTGPYGMGTYGTPRPAGVSTAFVPRYALWSFAQWGEDVLFLSSEDNRLFQYVSATPDTTPSPVASAPGPAPPVPTANAVGVTDERHIVLVGPTIGGVYYPHRVCWASSESLTDWDFASVTNTAGFLDLQCSSALNFIVKVREGLLLCSSTEIFLMTYVALPYVYGVTKIAEMPMFHPYSIAPYDNGKAMWPSNRGIQVYAAGVVQTIPCPIFNDIRINFSFTWGIYRTHASANGNFPEVWIFWPSLNATECDRYAIVNYTDGWWGWGYLGRSAMFPSGALQRPYCGTADGNIFEHENGWTNAGLPLLSQRYLETGALGISGGNQVVDIKQAMLATNTGAQVVQLQFFGRYTPEGQEYVFGPYLPRSDGYTDTRVNAREARVRYVGNVDDVFEIGLLRLDVSGGGQR